MGYENSVPQIFGAIYTYYACVYQSATHMHMWNIYTHMQSIRYYACMMYQRVYILGGEDLEMPVQLAEVPALCPHLLA